MALSTKNPGMSQSARLPSQPSSRKPSASTHLKGRLPNSACVASKVDSSKRNESFIDTFVMMKDGMTIYCRNLPVSETGFQTINARIEQSYKCSAVLYYVSKEQCNIVVSTGQDLSNAVDLCKDELSSESITRFKLILHADVNRKLTIDGLPSLNDAATTHEAMKVDIMVSESTVGTNNTHSGEDLRADEFHQLQECNSNPLNAVEEQFGTISVNDPILYIPATGRRCNQLPSTLATNLTPGSKGTPVDSKLGKLIEVLDEGQARFDFSVGGIAHSNAQSFLLALRTVDVTSDRDLLLKELRIAEKLDADHSYVTNEAIRYFNHNELVTMGETDYQKHLDLTLGPTGLFATGSHKKNMGFFSLPKDVGAFRRSALPDVVSLLAPCWGELKTKDRRQDTNNKPKERQLTVNNKTTNNRGATDTSRDKNESITKVRDKERIDEAVCEGLMQGVQRLDSTARMYGHIICSYSFVITHNGTFLLQLTRNDVDDPNPKMGEIKAWFLGRNDDFVNWLWRYLTMLGSLPGFRRHYYDCELECLLFTVLNDLGYNGYDCRTRIIGHSQNTVYGVTLPEWMKIGDKSYWAVPTGSTSLCIKVIENYQERYYKERDISYALVNGWPTPYNGYLLGCCDAAQKGIQWFGEPIECVPASHPEIEAEPVHHHHHHLQQQQKKKQEQQQTKQMKQKQSKPERRQTCHVEWDHTTISGKKMSISSRIWFNRTPSYLLDHYGIVMKVGSFTAREITTVTQVEKMKNDITSNMKSIHNCDIFQCDIRDANIVWFDDHFELIDFGEAIYKGEKRNICKGMLMHCGASAKATAVTLGRAHFTSSGEFVVTWGGDYVLEEYPWSEKDEFDMLDAVISKLLKRINK